MPKLPVLLTVHLTCTHVHNGSTLHPSDLYCSSFFGNFGFGFGNQGGEREIPRGGTITMELYVSLEDLYKGSFIEVRVCVCTA